MIKLDYILAAVLAGILIAEAIFAGKAGIIIGLLNLLCGASAMYYYLMRKGVLG